MAKKYSFSEVGCVVAGKLKIHNVARFTETLASWPEGPVAIRIIVPYAVRSLQANAYYWRVVNAIAEHVGHSDDDIHESLKRMFLPKKLAMLGLNGELICNLIIGGSSADLDKEEFYDYVERIRDWARSDLGLDIPPPDPTWRQHQDWEVAA